MSKSKSNEFKRTKCKTCGKNYNTILGYTHTKYKINACSKSCLKLLVSRRIENEK